MRELDVFVSIVTSSRHRGPLLITFATPNATGIQWFPQIHANENPGGQ